MDAKQRQFWGPYIVKIGAKNFSTNGMFVFSKHYCGMDFSKAEGAEQFAKQQLERIIMRHDEYASIVSKPKLSKDDLDYIFMLVEKQYYDEELVELINNDKLNVSDEDFWQIVMDIWVRQELNSDGSRKRNWKKIFTHRPTVPSLTAELPDTFVAFRAGKEDGFSWTLDKAKAQWFHNRFRMEFGNIPFLERTFSKEDALFYTNQRQEQEVVIIPQRKQK